MPARESASHGAADTVSFEQAVSILGVPGHYLTQLLDARAIRFELLDGQQRIPVRELDAYRQRRSGAQAALRMGGLKERSAGRPDR